MALVLCGAAAAQNSACHATPQEKQKTVTWTGGAGDLGFSADQLDCKVSSSLPWISVSVMPPISGSMSQRMLHFTVDTNFSPHKRSGQIQIGDSPVTIDQDSGPLPGMAFSPSRLEFSYSAGSPVTEITKSLFVGSDEPLVFVAQAGKTDWLKIKPEQESSAAQKQRKFLVTVNAAKLEPGAYKADIELRAEGASNSKEVVPVILRVVPPGDGKL